MRTASSIAIRLPSHLQIPKLSRRSLWWVALLGGTLACAAFGSSWGMPTSAAVAPSVVTMAAIMLAALLSSIGGFAFSAICGAMLFHLLPDPVQVVQIMIVCSIANQTSMTWALRRDIDWHGLPVFMAGGLAGVPIGVWVLLNVNRATYTVAFGVLLTAYGLWMLFRRPIHLRFQHPALDIASGFLSGIAGGATGFPSSFLTIWVGFKGWDKNRQRALFQPFIVVTQLLALAAISYARPSGSNAGELSLTEMLYLPGSLLGTAIGMGLFRRLSDTQFGRTVNVMLMVSGLSYLI